MNRPRDPIDAMPGAVLAGDRRAIARALSAIEQGAPQARPLHAALAPHLGRAHIVGITGAPGAGKSTLIDALLGELLARGQRVAVVAVDPSSPITGGAVLGDRVRMGRHGAHPDVFIRSVASRGHLGGLSPTTRQALDVFDAAGFGTVIVETVGAGQSEVEIIRVADTRIVVCPPGLGDGVQAIKAGILEIADLLVVTKSDLPGADATARDLRDMLQLRTTPADARWSVPVLVTRSDSGEGVAALLDAVQAHAAAVGHGRRLVARRGGPPAEAAAEPTDALVRRLADADAYLRHNAIECVASGPGRAELRLTLGPQHLNFNGTCHGGAIFTLADSAFGLASNSHGAVAAAIDAHITYQAAARAGDTLVARAHEVSRSRRLAVYRVDVSRSDGRPVSSFTGTVYLTGERHHR